MTFITLIFNVISKTYGSRDLAVLPSVTYLARCCSVQWPTAHMLRSCGSWHLGCLSWAVSGITFSLWWCRILVYYFHVHTLKPCTFYTRCYILHIHSGLLHRFARIPSSIYFWGIPSQTNWMTQGFWTLPWLGWAKKPFFWSLLVSELGGDCHRGFPCWQNQYKLGWICI